MAVWDEFIAGCLFYKNKNETLCDRKWKERRKNKQKKVFSCECLSIFSPNKPCKSITSSFFTLSTFRFIWKSVDRRLNMCRIFCELDYSLIFDRMLLVYDFSKWLQTKRIFRFDSIKYWKRKNTTRNTTQKNHKIADLFQGQHFTLYTQTEKKTTCENVNQHSCSFCCY